MDLTIESRRTLKRIMECIELPKLTKKDLATFFFPIRQKLPNLIC